MRAYLATTAALFGLLTVVHIWRMVVEADAQSRNPWILIITVVSAALCLRALRLLRRPVM